MTVHPGPVDVAWRGLTDARKVAVVVRTKPPQGSTQALAHQELVTAIERHEQARHPAFLIIPIIAALLQLLWCL